MAAHLGTATVFKISTGLFLKEEGSPYRFYYEQESDDLRSILRKGLGSLVNDPAEADILLCEKKTDNKITQGYLPIDFIVDCVKRNTFLNMDAYRANFLGLKASASKDESLNSPMNGRDKSEEERDFQFSESCRMRVKSDSLLGRKKYSDADDFKIIEYLIQHKKYTETGGNVVWKQMELFEVTDHSYQSMKARFQKKIRPEINTYKIPEIWKAKLRGGCTDDDDDEDDDEESVGEITFNYIDTWNSKLRKSSSKKEVPQVTPTRGSSPRTSVNEVTSAASPLNNDLSPAQPCGNTVANLNESDLESFTVSSSETLETEAENGEGANGHSGNLVESALHQLNFSAEKEQRKDTEDYEYDDLDYLILSEARKCKNSEGADATNNQKSHDAETVSSHSGDSSMGVTTRRQSKAINNFSCEENPPTNGKRDSPHVNKTGKRDTRKNKVILNTHFNSVETTSSSESERDKRNNKRSYQKKVTSDKMAGVSDQQKVTSDKMASVSDQQKVTSDKMASVSDQQKVTSDKMAGVSDQQKVTSDKMASVSDQQKVTSNKMAKVYDQQKVTSDKTIGVSERQKVTSEKVGGASYQRKVTSNEIVCISEEHVNSVNTILSVIKEGSARSDLPKTVHKKVATKKGSVRNSNSDSVDNVEETSLHSKSLLPKNMTRLISPLTSSGAHASKMRPEKEGFVTNNKSFEKSKKAPTKLANGKASVKKSHSGLDDSTDETSEQQPNSSRSTISKPIKRTLRSDESDVSSSCSPSPHKRKRKQGCTVAGPSDESTRLDHGKQKSTTEDESSIWLTKDETMMRVKFISEAYDLEIKEAALLLKLHNGSCLSAITYLESL